MGCAVWYRTVGNVALRDGLTECTPAAACGHWPDKDKEKEFEVTDIFVLLNRNGDSTLTKEEFDSIFTTLQIKVSPRRVGHCAWPELCAVRAAQKPLLL